MDDCIARAFKGTPAQDSLRRLMQVDLETQLAEDLLMLTDKMSMATSLECRVPLLDQQLVELAARMPEQVKIQGGALKHVMKSALKDVLPDSILQRGKRGFGAPIGAWFKNELKGLVADVLSPTSVERRGLFNPSAVQNLITQHAGSREDRTDHLLTLINLEVWCRLYLDGHSAEGIADELRSRLAA
jgi:asparagine synthase (glutamine-hydrolysing)